MELGNVRAERQSDAKFTLTARLVIILGNSLANFCRRDANDRVQVGVVIRATAKDFHAERSFLQKLYAAIEFPFDNVAQQTGISPATPKKRTIEQARELFAHIGSVWRELLSCLS